MTDRSRSTVISKTHRIDEGDSKMNRLCLLLAVLMIFLAAPSSNAGLIVNGGFENSIPRAPSDSFVTLFAVNSTSMAPWVIQSGSVDVVNTGFWPAYEGQQSLDLNGLSPATIVQTFTTTPGTTYTLTFEYGNNPDASPAATAAVSVIDSGGGTLLSQDITHSGSTSTNINYTPFSESFVADTTVTTLQFAGTNSGPYGIVLDAVSVNPTAVPEPSSLVVALSAIPMCLGYWWRRRRAKITA
jgi:choice-of-anchor C domain-containing protein